MLTCFWDIPKAHNQFIPVDGIIIPVTALWRSGALPCSWNRALRCTVSKMRTLQLLLLLYEIFRTIKHKSHLLAVSVSVLYHSTDKCVFVCTNLHFDLFRTGTGGYNRWTGDSSVAPVLAQWTYVSYLSGHVEEHNDDQRMSAPLLRWLYHHSFEIWVSFTIQLKPGDPLSVPVVVFRFLIISPKGGNTS